MRKKSKKASQNKVVMLALNAKFSHTCTAIRYLRQSCIQRGVAEPELLELTINIYIPDILGQIYERQPRVLGIACYIWNIEMVKVLLPLVHKVLPNTIIICGGPEVSYDTEAFLRENRNVNYVIRGEGEIAFPNLLECCFAEPDCNARTCIPGVAYLVIDRYVDGGIVSLPALDAASLPFLYTENEIDSLKDRILYYETSRGCPFSCAYCLSCATEGVRYRPWEVIEAELTFFVSHNVRQVKFVDRTFNASQKHFWPILQFIKALPDSCRTNFHFEIAADYLDEETIALLQALPKHRVQLEIGIQTTNEQVLARIQRKNHWDRIADNIRQLLKNHNMHIHTDLIIGLPDEDMASFAFSFNMVYELDTDMLQLGFLKFLKGSAMMDLVEKYGYKYMDIGPYEVLSSRNMSYGEIHWLHIFEEVFELYHNAGRCRTTCNYYIAVKENGDSFAFYQKLADFWQENSYHHQPHSAKSLYCLLAEFVQWEYADADVEDSLLDNLLRFDALLADGGKNRPEQLNWNREKYQAITADFWRNQGEAKAVNYVDGFEFTTWRTICQSYQLERFEYPIHEAVGLAKACQPVLAEAVWLLFDFTSGDSVWQVVSNIE